MGTAFNPAKTSPASWDAFSDVDTFVNPVLAEHAGLYDDCCCAADLELDHQHEEAVASKQ